MPRPKKKMEVAIQNRFVPKFWEHVDGRSAVVKEIRQRYQQLKEDTGADSFQKDLLVQRAIFIGVQLETMEVEATESGKFDAGVYTQMVNAFKGLLKDLGLERKMPTAVDLKAYVNGSSRR